MLVLKSSKLHVTYSATGRIISETAHEVNRAGIGAPKFPKEHAKRASLEGRRIEPTNSEICIFRNSRIDHLNLDKLHISDPRKAHKPLTWNFLAIQRPIGGSAGGRGFSQREKQNAWSRGA
ncbi:hypothetical protein, partial [Streptomyces albiaxialis]|uniref:hypothetical protein n=1 Tax=Streptomyces albiaxialis TaxID=329523 RepID=UPI0031E0063C